MVLLQTFGLHLLKCGEIFGAHLGKNSFFSQLFSCKKKFTSNLSIFCYFADISDNCQYELKGSPGILDYNLSLCQYQIILILKRLLSIVKFLAKLLPNLLKYEIPLKCYSRILAMDLLAFIVASHICSQIKSYLNHLQNFFPLKTQR